MEAYRFLIPEKLTPEVLLHTARRLAEAQAEGHDMSLATIDGKYIVVPVRKKLRRELVKKDGLTRAERTDQYRTKMVAYVKAHGAVRATDIARAVYLTSGQLPFLLGSLIKAGRLERDGVLYRIPLPKNGSAW